MMIETLVLAARKKDSLDQAVKALQAGGLIAFPTDTVYGLAALPTDEHAVCRIYEVKGRNADNPIALLLSDTDQLEKVAHWVKAARLLARRFWPGGLSLVLPKTDQVIEPITALPTVAVRIPDLPLARRLIHAAGGVLAVTSANQSGEPPALNAAEVMDQLKGQIELVLDGGPCKGGVPSTVLDCTIQPPAIVRHGSIKEAEILKVLRAAGFA